MWILVPWQAFLFLWFPHLLLPLPLVLVLLFVLLGFGVSRHLGLSIEMLLCLLSWRPLPGLLALSLLLSISLMFNFHPLKVLGRGPVVAAGSVV